MKWSRSEIDRLNPILEQISVDLAPVEGKKILVLCSAAGEVAFRLAEMMETGKVTGLERDDELLELARRAVREMGLGSSVEFLPAQPDHIPLEDESYDALVSEFVVYPSPLPTQVGQSEMARVLTPGGKMILTDVITTNPLAPEVREELEIIGLDYLCDATQEDFRHWMEEAGLVNIQVLDLTPTLREVWEARQETDTSMAHQVGYAYLLDDQELGLGKTIYYIYAIGVKPNEGG